MKFIMGMITPEMNWAFHAASKSLALMALNSRTDSPSRPKALTMTWPVYISSTWPLRAPSSFCWSPKLFWESLVTFIVATMATGRVTRAISVSQGLIVTIMTRTPTMVHTEVMSWVRLCCRVVLMLSMSLVTRLMISPWVLESKYLSGRRASLSFTSLRMSYTMPCETPAIVYCWM